jgi:predicted Zn-dependent peptidase
MGRLLPAMTQEKLDTQRDVVKNERRWSVDNQPYGTWWEKLPALCYPPTHPFHHSLIGSMEDLDAASLDDVAEFFATWYTPDNAVLTIAGDFDPADARALVEKHFGPIPRGPGRPALPSFDLPPTFGATLKEVVPDDVVLPRVFLAFRAPVFGSDGYYAAGICGAVLGLRNGSRLHERLVRERQLASETSASTFDLPVGADLLILDAIARPDVDADTLAAALAEEVDRLREEGVRPEEVERALALIETGFVAAMQSAGERADQLSRFATYLGDPSLVNEQVDRYRAVTADDVNAFARASLGPDNRAYLMYVPKAQGEETAELVGAAALA